MHTSRFELYLSCLIFSGFMVFHPHANATHLRTADIVVEQADCHNPFRFKITVVAYINTGATSNFGGGFSMLYFGDGSFTDIDEVTETPRPDLGNNIGIATYTTYHTYAGQGLFTITYMERDAVVAY